jgi:hypothetical protein
VKESQPSDHDARHNHDQKIGRREKHKSGNNGDQKKHSKHRPRKAVCGNGAASFLGLRTAQNHDTRTPIPE